MAVKGIDTISDITNIASTIKEKGYSFAIRYYSLSGNSKRMSTSESAAIANAGLKRIVVYQNKHNEYSKFSASIAQNDASDAITQAKTHGQTSGSVIYFAVNYDAPLSEINANIMDYFTTLNSLIQKGGYYAGVYGSSLVCKTLREAGVVTKSWLTMSSGWGYGTTYNNYNIKQVKTTTIGGIEVDTDTADSLTSIGAW